MPRLMGPHFSGTETNFNINSDIRNSSNCQVQLKDIFAHSNNIHDIENACGNGSNSNIYRCSDKRCQFKHQFYPTDKFFSSVTKRVYDCVLPAGTRYIDCHSANVIYLITCSKCKLQYVGETIQQLNKRFNWHKSGFRDPVKYGHCKILSDHFTKGLCAGVKYKVQIIEKMDIITCAK